MKILIQAPDVNRQLDLERFIHEKVGKLWRFSDEILDARVMLRIDNSDNRENKVCEIKIAVSHGSDLFASRQSKSFEEATSDVVEALRKQIESRK